MSGVPTTPYPPAASSPVATLPTAGGGGNGGGGAPWWIDTAFRAILYVGIPSIALGFLGVGSWKLVNRYLDAADAREKILQVQVVTELTAQAVRLTTIERQCSLDGPPDNRPTTRPDVRRGR